MNINGFTRRAQNNEEPIKIGFSTPDLNDRFLRYVEIAARRYAEQNNIEFLLADAQNNVTTQQQQIKQLIDQGVQSLIVIPVDTDAMAPVTAFAKGAGIPLVYLNRNPYHNEDLPEGVYYVGSKSIASGILQGEILGEKLQVGNVGLLLGDPNVEVTTERTKGLKMVLDEKYPDIKVIVEGTANYDRDQAYTLVKDWLKKYGTNLNAIAANNDEMALGAIKALAEAGRKDVLVFGIDGLEVGRTAIRNGTLAGTVFQDGDVQGATAVQIAQQLAKGEKPAEQITWIPYILITPDVITKYPENIIGWTERSPISAHDY